MAETILQHPIALNFIYPFLLVFFIVFAVLERTKILGEEKKQLNALVSFVVSLIFVSALSPKLIISNLITFLSIGLVIVFVILLLGGFVYSGKEGLELTSAMKTGLGIVITIALIFGILWATGVSGNVYDSLFNQSWSEAFWSNFFFIVLIGIALGVILKSKK